MFITQLYSIKRWNLCDLKKQCNTIANHAISSIKMESLWFPWSWWSWRERFRINMVCWGFPLGDWFFVHFDFLHLQVYYLPLLQIWSFFYNMKSMLQSTDIQNSLKFKTRYMQTIRWWVRYTSLWLRLGWEDFSQCLQHRHHVELLLWWSICWTHLFYDNFLNVYLY